VDFPTRSKKLQLMIIFLLIFIAKDIVILYVEHKRHS